MICPRCLNQDPQYFAERNGQIYCRKCLTFGQNKDTICIEYKPAHVSYHLDYQLTELQFEISQNLLQRYKNKQNTIVKAVCGAGKTEMIYEVLKYALNQGHKVCLTIPRKELVIELANRIKKQFSHIDPILVYGGHNKIIDGQFIVCTTHQLYRYRNCFDLLILDECDAFPYAKNDVLKNMLLTSIKGQYIWMSATTTKGDLNMNRRYHGKDLPIPKCIKTTVMMMYILMIKRLKQYKAKQEPVLIFVPEIRLLDKIVKIVRFFQVKSQAVSSQSKNIQESLNQLKNHQLDVLVCTTILERGMTIPNVQVIILYSHHPIFDKGTLIQIAGRVGRNVPYTYGDVIFYTQFRTEAIVKCIQQLEKDNA